MALMRRQSLVKFDAPLCETIVDTPKPQGREVLVRIERCGLCHSDLHIQDGYADLGGGKRLDTTRGMLDLARDIIGSQPILTAFLAIGVGYLVGQINIFGFSLGVGAVLFVGLAIGAFAPKAQIIGPIGLTGLIMRAACQSSPRGRRPFAWRCVWLPRHRRTR